VTNIDQIYNFLNFSEIRILGLSADADFVSIGRTVWPQPTNVMDDWTDRRTDILGIADYILPGGRSTNYPPLKLLGMPASLPLYQRNLWACPKDRLRTDKQINKRILGPTPI